jgi:hypothetical protein
MPPHAAGEEEDRASVDASSTAGAAPAPSTTEPPQHGGQTGDHGGRTCCPRECKHIQRPRGAFCHTCSPSRRGGGPLDGGGSPRAPQ